MIYFYLSDLLFFYLPKKVRWLIVGSVIILWNSFNSSSQAEIAMYYINYLGEKLDNNQLSKSTSSGDSFDTVLCTCRTRWRTYTIKLSICILKMFLFFLYDLIILLKIYIYFVYTISYSSRFVVDLILLRKRFVFSNVYFSLSNS